jgi:Ca-activated chloride channel family protein
MTILSYKFDSPMVIVTLLAVIPLYLYFQFKARQTQVIPYPPLQYKAGKSWLRTIFGLFIITDLLLLILLFISLANPYKKTEAVSIKEDGLDVLLAIDVSASMQALDFPPNRLEATKTIVNEFVRRSGGNRVGIMVFAKHVFTLSTLTTDHLILKNHIDGLSLDTIDHYKSGGTAIGDAILRGTEILKTAKIPGRDQVMILLTDGDSNVGSEIGLATKYAIENHVRIHTIGIGTTAEIEVRPDPKNQPDWFFTTKLIEAPMKEIAQVTLGRYFHAANKEIMSDIFIELSRLERTPLEIDRLQQKKYARFPLNASVAGLFTLSIILRVLFLRRPLK